LAQGAMKKDIIDTSIPVEKKGSKKRKLTPAGTVERTVKPKGEHLDKTPPKVEAPAQLDPTGIDTGATPGTFAPDVLLEEGFKPPSMEDITWVFHAIGRPEVSEKDAPNPGAWGWLQGIRANPRVAETFYTQVLTKTLPRNVNGRKGREDDGELIRLLSRVEAAARSAKSEDPESVREDGPPDAQGELAVSA